jgi:hypothetical protein
MGAVYEPHGKKLLTCVGDIRVPVLTLPMIRLIVFFSWFSKMLRVVLFVRTLELRIDARNRAVLIVGRLEMYLVGNYFCSQQFDDPWERNNLSNLLQPCLISQTQTIHSVGFARDKHSIYMGVTSFVLWLYLKNIIWEAWFITIVHIASWIVQLHHFLAIGLSLKSNKPSSCRYETVFIKISEEFQHRMMIQSFAE